MKVGAGATTWMNPWGRRLPKQDRFRAASCAEGHDASKLVSAAWWPARRAALPRSSSSASGLRFWGMRLEPVE